VLNAHGPFRPDLPGAFPGMTVTDRRGPASGKGIDQRLVRQHVERLHSAVKFYDAACEQVARPGLAGPSTTRTFGER